MNKLKVFLQHFAANTKKQHFIILVISISSVAALFQVPHSTAKSVSVSQSAPALTVTVTAAHRAKWPAILEASGTIAPWQEAIIGAQVSGLRLIDVRVNVGDQVKRGQVLAIFDSALLLADETRLKATYQQAEANRKRALKLKGGGAISDQDILQYSTQAEVAKAQLETTQLQIRYSRVIAPDDGVISARNATLGSVSNNGQELFRMIRQNRLEWRGELTAAQLAQVKAHQDIHLTLPDGNNADAKVRQMAPTIDTQTRLGILFADIRTGSSARAGMYAKGVILLREQPATVVPAACVVIRDGYSYVVKIGNDHRVSLQAVTVGRHQQNEVEIVSGMTPGENVVVQGAGFLNDGDVVRVASTTTARPMSHRD